MSIIKITGALIAVWYWQLANVYLTHVADLQRVAIGENDQETFEELQLSQERLMWANSRLDDLVRSV